MRIPDNIIEAIKDRVDIVQVVGRHVQLKRAGRNHVGLCPFHNEKSPSFNVSPDRKIFHCFGCGEGGDVFKFISKHQNRPFPEVVKELGREVGVEVPEREETPEEKEAERVRNRQLAVVERALHVFLDQLQAIGGAEARAYLKSRNFGEKAWAEFELGFGGGRDILWTTLGKTEEDKQDLLKAGLCVTNERGTYDRFSGRIIFPIRDEKFRVIGFGGRVFGERAKRDGVAKYLNSSEGPLYDKSQVFYRAPQAFQKARKGAPVVVVEGYFDAMALEMMGLAAVASCGTALTPRHAQILNKQADQVVLCWDGDAAGERAVQRAANVLLPLKVDTRIAVLPVGDDPDTYVARTGVTGANRLVQEAEALPTWVIAQTARLLEEAGDDVPRRVEVIRGLAWLFQAIPAGLERDMYVEQAAKKLEVEKPQLMHELQVGAIPRPVPADKNAPGNASRPPQGRPAAPPRPAPPPPGPPKLTGEEKALVHLLAEHPHRAQALDEHPLASNLSKMLRPFLAFVREKVQETGPFSVDSPTYREVREKAPNQQVVEIWDEVTRGHRVFGDEEEAEKAVFQLLLWLKRNDLETKKRALLLEAKAAEERGDREQLDSLKTHLRAINDELRRAQQQERPGNTAQGTQG